MKSRKKDPYAAREQAKYESPVSSRELILEHLEARGEPLVLEQLAHDLDHQDEAGFEGLRRRIGAMVRDGQLVRNRRNGYGVATKMDLVSGRVQGHKDGFGFLIPEAGGEDLFLSARQMRGVMHGDRVMARVSGVDRRGRLEGAIVEVLEHATTTLAGRVYIEKGVTVVVPTQARLTQEILIPEEHRNSAEHGQMVVAEITSYPEAHRQPVGIIARVLGDHMAPGMEIDVALHSFDLPHEWPEAVVAEADKVPVRVPPKAKAGREDLRDLPLLTIDGEDARDFDDAVYCERDGKGWRLLVAIADVSYYVTPKTGLDEEALNRGNSVYFPEQVIPMLPEVLSNGLCSLNPRVDRLCMVCEMHLGPRGKVNKARFFEGVMRSKSRLTYTQVAAILDGDKALNKRFAKVVPQLQDLHALYQHLAKLRRQRGAIDFDSTETRIVFGEDRKIDSIVPVERNDAHRLIEECMIAANVAAGEFLTKHRIPGLYRVHKGPAGDRLAKLRDFLAEVGLQLEGGDEPGPQHYAKMLKGIKDRPDAQLIQTVMLRSLKQAVYSPENHGHFGLAVKAYAHFTSPIRRYPDLLLHRAIKHILGGGKAKDFIYGLSEMEHLGEHCSMTSRRADEASWDVEGWLKAEYMLDKVEQRFSGIVTSVTGFGLFVQLNDIFVEGLVHVSALQNDYYHFDPVTHRLTGERTGKSYRLGDPVDVIVSRVDLDERRIDFVLVPESVAGDEPAADGKPGKTSKSGKGKHRKGAGKSKKSGSRESRPVEEQSADVPQQEPAVEAVSAEAPVDILVADAPPTDADNKPARAKKPRSRSRKPRAAKEAVETVVEDEQPPAAPVEVAADAGDKPAKKKSKPRRRRPAAKKPKVGDAG